MEGVDQALENQDAVIGAKDWFAGTFGMGHEASDGACFIANAGDVFERAVRVRNLGKLTVRV